MRAVIQRVKEASVTVSGEITGRIGPGMLVLLGIAKDDAESNADELAGKLVNLRIFEDENGKMNLSAADCPADFLVVSQFTLYGDCRKGRRPSFDSAAPPEQAEKLYEYFISSLSRKGCKVETGRFKAMMDVSLINDGPVTLILEF